jgi:hypothetical protein
MNIFKLIAEAAEKAGIRLILIGGFAVNAYNYARNTRDIDFLTTEEDYGKLSIALPGYKESVRTNVFAKQIQKKAGAMPVDFLFVDPKTFESIWRDGKQTVLFGHEFRIPSLLNLLALKLHAVKRGSKDRAWKDIPDIINLIIANGIDAGSPEIQDVCRKYGPDGIHSEILKGCSGGQDGRS